MKPGLNGPAKVQIARESGEDAQPAILGSSKLAIDGSHVCRARLRWGAMPDPEMLTLRC